jgi:hypothetical protein
MILYGGDGCADFGGRWGAASAENFSRFSARFTLSVSVDRGRGGGAVGSMTERTSMLRRSSHVISQHPMCRGGHFSPSYARLVYVAAGGTLSDSEGRVRAGSAHVIVDGFMPF